MVRRSSGSGLAALLAALLTACATPGSPPAFSVPARFTALGTEPFWAAKVDGARLTYTTPLDEAGRTIVVTRRATATSVEIDGTLTGRRLTLTVTAGPCSDGMSDTVYPLSVVRRVGDAVQSGCARPD